MVFSLGIKKAAVSFFSLIIREETNHGFHSFYGATET